MAGKFSKTYIEKGFSIGVSQDKLQWSIAGTISGTDPNIFSELKWRDIGVLHARYFIRSYDKRDGHLYYNVDLDYGMILRGENQDSDYNADNRQDEFSRSVNSADGGQTTNMSAAIGYMFGKKYIRGGNWMLIPLLGYSQHSQILEMTEGNQVIATQDLTPDIGPFGGLDSKYNAEWKGLWAGTRLEYNHYKKMNLFIEYQLHKIQYSAEADWNLRDELQHPKSFIHSARGLGKVISMGINYKISKTTDISISFDYFDFGTNRGLDETYYNDGAFSRTQLNGVTWESSRFLIQPTFRF